MKPEIKLYYVIPAVFLLILIVITLLLSGKKQSPQKTIKPTIIPLPTEVLFPDSETQNELIPTDDITISPTPMPIANTGADETQNIPPEETNLAIEKKELRSKLPYSESGFSITFNFAEDIFEVTLLEPKDTNRVLFETWRSDNYPSIPLDRFRLN